jgi:hypothetical protein
VATPFTVDSPNTGQAVWGVDANGNTIQSGAITSGDGITLTKTPTPSNPSQGALKLYSPDGETAYTLDATGNQSVLTPGPGQGGLAWFNVKSFGAQGVGTDDTAAVDKAISTAQTFGGGNGAVVYFPAGVYGVLPPAGSAAITLNNGTTGYKGIRLVGDSAQASSIKKLGNGVMISMSGPASDPTGATHCTYCSIENLHLSGGNFTGSVLQCYYADNLYFRDIDIVNNADICVDGVEFWDSRFYNMVIELSGSQSADASTPNVLLRCSAAASGFGASTDTTNEIHFVGCRFEHFYTGALWIQQGTGSSSGCSGIYLVNNKMETSSVNGGPHLLADSVTRRAYVDNLYCFSGGFNTGYSTAQDLITWSAQDSCVNNAFFATNAVQTVANGITLNSTVANQNAVIRNVTGIYNAGGLPTGTHIAYGTGTGGFTIDNCTSNQTIPTNQAANKLLVEATSGGNALGTLVSGDAFKRYVFNAKGDMSWGGGNAGADVVMTRSATGVLSVTSGILDPQHGTKTTSAAAVLTPTFANGTAAQLSDTTRDYILYFTVGTAGTGPTSNPANTIVSSSVATSGELYTFRLPAGWFVKWADTTGTLANQIAIGC